MIRLADKVAQESPRRNPPYRPMATTSAAERQELARKLGSADNYNSQALRDLIPAAPRNTEMTQKLPPPTA